MHYLPALSITIYHYNVSTMMVAWAVPNRYQFQSPISNTLHIFTLVDLSFTLSVPPEYTVEVIESFYVLTLSRPNHLTQGLEIWCGNVP